MEISANALIEKIRSLYGNGDLTEEDMDLIRQRVEDLAAAHIKHEEEGKE